MDMIVNVICGFVMGYSVANLIRIYKANKALKHISKIIDDAIDKAIKELGQEDDKD